MLSIPIDKLPWMLLESATEKVLDQIDRSLLHVAGPLEQNDRKDVSKLYIES